MELREGRGGSPLCFVGSSRFLQASTFEVVVAMPEAMIAYRIMMTLTLCCCCGPDEGRYPVPEIFHPL